MASYFDDRSGFLPRGGLGGPPSPYGDMSYGDLMRGARQQQLFNSLTAVGAGLMQAGAGGPYGSRQQGLANAFQGMQQTAPDPMDAVRAKYMMGQMEQQQAKAAAAERQAAADQRLGTRLRFGETMSDIMGTPEGQADLMASSYADKYMAQAFQPTTEEELDKYRREREIAAEVEAGQPLDLERKADLYQKANPGVSRLEALNWAKTTRTQDLSGTPLNLGELQTLNLPAGTTWESIQGMQVPPAGTSVPPGGAPPQPALAPPPPAPLPGVPGAPPPPALPGPETPMEQTAAEATGPWSNIQQGLSNVLGGYLRAEEVFAENSKARNDLRLWERSITPMLVNNPKLPVAEQAVARANIPSPDEWLTSPGKAMDKVANLRQHLENTIVANEASLRATISDTERQRLLDQNETYKRALATFGPKPTEGSRFNPIQTPTPADAQNLEPGTYYRRPDGKVMVR